MFIKGDYGYGTLWQRIYKKNRTKMSSKRKFHYTIFETILRTLETNELIAHKMNLYYTVFIYEHIIGLYNQFVTPISMYFDPPNYLKLTQWENYLNGIEQ